MSLSFGLCCSLSSLDFVMLVFLTMRTIKCQHLSSLLSIIIHFGVACCTFPLFVTSFLTNTNICPSVIFLISPLFKHHHRNATETKVRADKTFGVKALLRHTIISLSLCLSFGRVTQKQLTPCCFCLCQPAVPVL